MLLACHKLMDQELPIRITVLDVPPGVTFAIQRGKRFYLFESNSTYCETVANPKTHSDRATRRTRRAGARGALSFRTPVDDVEAIRS